jgi:hypothetical protein
MIYVGNNVGRQQANAIDYNSADGNRVVAVDGKNLNEQARWGNLTAASFGMIGPMQKGRLCAAQVTCRF